MLFFYKSNFKSPSPCGEGWGEVLFFLLFLFSLSTFAQRRNSDYDAYINKYSAVAVEQMKLYRIPASITLAQGLLESGAGKSTLAVRGNNHFGIKCHGWSGGTIYHDDDESGECFRSYSNAKESFEDHSQFLLKERYKRLFSYDLKDYRSWARGLKACGYATSPTYAESLISIIERYELYRFDSNKNSGSQAPSTVNSQQSTVNSHTIRYNNGIPYVLAQRGDTYKTIAKEVGKSYRKLAKYNERNAKDALEENEIVYLKKKAKKGEKKYKAMVYLVKEGDSMYSISQHFAIRLKYLYRLNGLTPDAKISVGQRIYLR
ncbi:MAG: glucosaminidase domain-containing protein [Bacteroidaceae bacterium]|nr:glucosaminidase domain-containing protein [Bacteroidaceae bacterium]